ncbi:hypothetical protein [Desulfonatronovibrio magnus]|uniref:hypothetical protein n=1 Tax=Desulfonatronovibrio magnus TaxID=698827 RepID=UPI0005EB2E5D|nr:hypothetical protein [Desulfonatronovibrio magnus]
MKYFFMLSLACLIFLTGCAASNSVIMPQEGGTYQIVTYGSSERQANQEAVSEATKVCNEAGRNMIVLNHASKYEGGLAKGDKELIQLGSQIASMLDGKISPVNTSSPNDYKVVIHFRCE